MVLYAAKVLYIPLLTYGFYLLLFLLKEKVTKKFKHGMIAPRIRAGQRLPIA